MFLRLFCGQRMFSKLCFCCNSCLLLFLVCFGLTIWHWHGLGYQKEACHLTQQCLKHCPKSCKAICRTSRNCRSISLQRSRGFLHFSRCFFTTWLLDNNSEWHNLALSPLNCRVALCLYAATEYAGKVRNHSPHSPHLSTKLEDLSDFHIPFRGWIFGVALTIKSMGWHGAKQSLNGIDIAII